jgi:hypothetical protein
MTLQDFEENEDTELLTRPAKKGRGAVIKEAGQAIEQRVVISPPRFQTAVFQIKGISPLVQARFSEKAKLKMMADMQNPEANKTKRGTRKKRNFDDECRAAMHVSTEGWIGVPASAFRNAMIDACRLCGFKMTLAKLTVFVDADGFDEFDGLPLVKIDNQGGWVRTEMHARNSDLSTDVRVRPMWREWGVNLRVTFDEDQFKLEDVANLLSRAGRQVGIGEGRPNSRKSNGLGWGLFEAQGMPQ